MFDNYDIKDKLSIVKKNKNFHKIVQQKNLLVI